MYLILATILLSWLPQFRYHPIAQVILSLTAPYLNFWRRFGLQVGGFDFSVILGIVFLTFIQNSLRSIAISGSLRLAVVIMFFSDVFFTILSVFFSIMAIMATLRFIALVFMRSNGPFSMMVDRFLRRPVMLVNNMFARGKMVKYHHALIIIAVSGFIIWQAINYVRFIANGLIAMLPF